MTGRAWTPEEDSRLAALWALGKTARFIGKALGRSRNSIIGRANKLPGIQRRASPIQRARAVAPVQAIRAYQSASKLGGAR